MRRLALFTFVVLQPLIFSGTVCHAANNGMALCRWPAPTNFSFITSWEGSASVGWTTGLALFQTFDPNGVRRWPGCGVPVSPTGFAPFGATSDGGGGAIVGFVDARSGSNDIYAQRLSSAGATLWNLDGVPVCTASGQQRSGTLVQDDAGGAILVWDDHRAGIGPTDIYAQRIDPSGTSLWAPDGVPVSTANEDQGVRGITSDGAGGVIIVWIDYRIPGPPNVYAQRIDRTGSPLWTLDGIAVCDTTSTKEIVGAVPDGSGGVIVAWSDSRSGNSNVYAQRIDGSGTP